MNNSGLLRSIKGLFSMVPGIREDFVDVGHLYF